MKKILLIFALLLTVFTTQAQNNVIYETTHELAIKINNQWSEWKPCNVTIKIDLDQDKVTIYSDEVQIYRIIGETISPNDNSGKQISFLIIDQDGDKGRMRFRVQNDGIRQIYIDFNNISWCYTLK